MENYHPEKGPFLRQLVPDDHFIGFYLLRCMQLEPFQDASRGYFLTLILGDRSGQLLARVWENAEDTYQQLSEGDVVKIDGEVETYLERTQIRVLRVRPAATGEYDIRDMLPASRRDSDEMMAEFQFFVDNIQDEHLASLVNTFYGDEQFSRLFSQAPASRRIHHAYLHGLLEHTLEILTLSNTLVDLYPEINVDLLTAGILLHDIGKVREFTWDLDIDYTKEGRLLGHIVLGDEMVSGAIADIPGFPAELALNLRHMLLAHHGKYEWGSPRRPMTLEGIVLHHLENLSTQANRFKLLLESRPAGQSWTEYDRMLGRQLYAGDDDNLSIEERSFEE
jgi:3'-5' exoribonuclease